MIIAIIAIQNRSDIIPVGFENAGYSIWSS
jgi:hypothetical protein